VVPSLSIAIKAGIVLDANYGSQPLIGG